MSIHSNAFPIDERIGYAVEYVPAECLGDEFPLPWRMVRPERICLLHLLKQFDPELSLEIGTFKGGSLQVLSRYSKEVISVDINPDAALGLKGRFDNVTFKSGDSSVLLPQVIREINESEKRLGIVLIDGDHSEAGLRRDINAVLQLMPKRPVGIIMHDCFHPPVRAGILSADWKLNRHVHYVEVDFVNGVFTPGSPSTEESMYCGFAFALMLPEERKGELQVFQSEWEKFEIVKRFAGTAGFLAKRNLVMRKLKRATTEVRDILKRLAST
jgi:Methyltransferase domain